MQIDCPASSSPALRYGRSVQTNLHYKLTSHCGSIAEGPAYQLDKMDLSKIMYRASHENSGIHPISARGVKFKLLWAAGGVLLR